LELPSLLAALADPVRFRIVELLRMEPRHVSELVELLDESQPNVSRHLRTLHECGLVDRVKEGKWVRYGIRPGALDPLVRWAISGPLPAATPPERFPPVRPYDREAEEFFTGR
jgi:DNA-binding transcriptional ArsR family regulator